jgi:TonB family protein
MQFSRVLIPVAIFQLLIGLPAQTQNKSAPTQENMATRDAPPKAISTPNPPYPEEARKKGIEGKVTLLIVIDAKGKVSQVKALSGPEELVPAAVASVKMWQFEPFASGPVTRTVEVVFGFPKECPGPISESGEVVGSGRLTDKKGNLIAVVDYEENRPQLPPYPETERKAGVAGNMVLAITLGQDGHVKGIHATKSLSPGLDRAAIETVRLWQFKKIEGNADVSLENLRLEFIFRATCNPRF